MLSISRLQYLPLRDLDNVTSALNFDTPACHVAGGCDLYTTKAAGSDKKLYKSINETLESQNESLIRLSASLSPPDAEMFSLDLSRSSPFGPLSQVASRRTFAYLIATLNASHPDYDFSYILRPTDFRKEKRLQTVINTIDETLENVRPRPAGAQYAASNMWSPAGSSGTFQTPGDSTTWGPKCWKAIDKEMDLKDCEIFCYAPDDDPFDTEESAIWSLNYFFFNKHRKRVCYIYARGLSTTSHSPLLRASHNTGRVRQGNGSVRTNSTGASKRAKYWLGERAVGMNEAWDEDGDDDDLVLDDAGSDGEDVLSDRSEGFSDVDELDHAPPGDAASYPHEHIADTMDV